MHQLPKHLQYISCAALALLLPISVNSSANATPISTHSANESHPAVTPKNYPKLDSLFSTSPLSTASHTPKRGEKAGTLESHSPAELMINHHLWRSNAFQFTYNSTDSLARPSIDSGIYIEPQSPWTGPGHRPVIAFAPGTQGGGIQCDPSTALQEGFSIRRDNRDIVAPYEALSIAKLLKRGAAVVITDYHRNPEGRQEYVDNISAGQSLLDAASAALSLGDNSKDSPIALLGYSQGGAATAAAAERASTYAPELNIVAAAAGGIPSDLRAVLNSVDGTPLTGVLAMALSGILDKDPAIRDYLYTSELTPEYAKAVETSENVCTGGLIANNAFDHTTSWTRDGLTLNELINQYPAFIRELDRQKIGKLTPSMPVLLYHGAHDDIIPLEQATLVRELWLNRGADVTYFEDQRPPVPGRTGINHLLAGMKNSERATEFIWDKLVSQQ